MIALAISLLVSVLVSGVHAKEPQDAQGHAVSVNAAAFQSRAGADDVPFTRYDGSLFGLNQANVFGPRDFYPPFFNGGGISYGDIDRDGWLDLFGTTYLQGNFYLLSQKGEFSSAGLRQPPRVIWRC